MASNRVNFNNKGSNRKNRAYKTSINPNENECDFSSEPEMLDAENRNWVNVNERNEAIVGENNELEGQINLPNLQNENININFLYGI